MNISEIPSLIEISASTSAVVGAYLMGATTERKRIASFAFFSLANILTMKVAIDHNMMPLLAQMGVFSYLAFKGMNNAMETINVSEKSENKTSFISKLVEGKNKAVKSGMNRFSKFFDNTKDTITTIKNTIKNNKESVFLLTSACLLPLANQHPELSQTIISSVKSLLSSPTETIAAALALYGSYLMTFPTFESRAKGVTAFLAADFFYIGIAADKELYPLLTQSIIFLATSAKAIYDLDKGLKGNGSSYVNVIKDYVSDISDKFKNKDIKQEITGKLQENTISISK